MVTEQAQPVPGLPAVIHHEPSEGAGPDDPILFATGADGQPVVFPVTGTCPHMLVAGATGTGMTVAFKIVVLEAARRGIAVRLCCPNRLSAASFATWPNVTVASTAPDMARLIDRTYDAMMSRLVDADASAGPGQFPRILFAADCDAIVNLMIADWWAGVREGIDVVPAEHPSLRRFQALPALGAAAGINVLQGGKLWTGSAPGVADNFGTRVLLGRAPARTAEAILGDPAATADVPSGRPGAGTAVTADGLTRLQVHWLPDDEAQRIAAVPGRLIADGPPGDGCR